MSNSKFIYILGLVVLFLHFAEGYGQALGMMKVLGGAYTPLYGQNGTLVEVSDFWMDVYPVTNEQYLEFVQKEENWQRSNVKRLFAEESYLSHWEQDLKLGTEAPPKAPVTHVSWFAAKKYCEYLDKRLPTVDEWEYVGMANETSKDARTLKSYNQDILSWYEAPQTNTQVVGQTFKNYWGIYDLHGLVWEWALDFNSVLISGESRKDVDKDSNLFCGTAAIGASDLMNYAAFMRYAFRGSLKANYSMRNLGFRCVKEIKQTEQ